MSNTELLTRPVEQTHISETPTFEALANIGASLVTRNNLGRLTIQVINETGELTCTCTGECGMKAATNIELNFDEAIETTKHNDGIIGLFRTKTGNFVIGVLDPKTGKIEHTEEFNELSIHACGEGGSFHENDDDGPQDDDVPDPKISK